MLPYGLQVVHSLGWESSPTLMADGILPVFTIGRVRIYVMTHVTAAANKQPTMI
jgi:hypothetical protein